MIKKFKNGAASFYIVAFTTLVLLVVSLSFAAVVISLTERTSNNDLSQSAYDSAMAGIEDAQLLVFEYQKCKQGTRTDGCSAIIAAVEGGINEKTCGQMAEALGRSTDASGATLIKETTTSGDDSSLQQAYTCVKIGTELKNYQGVFTGFADNEVVKISLTNPDRVNDVKSVKVTWGRNIEPDNSYINSGTVVFPNQLSGIKTAAISVTLVQAGPEFNINDFTKVEGEGENKMTNLGTVFLVPTDGGASGGSYNMAGANNVIGKEAFLKSNNKSVENWPYVVRCDDVNRCNATIGLPQPIGGNRDADNFFFVLSYYGDGSMFKEEFTLEVCGGEAEECANGSASSEEDEFTQNSQIQIDSTGRANDLYRRIVARFNTTTSSAFLNLLGPLELFGTDNTLQKNFVTTCEYEYNFGGPTC